MSSVLGLRGLLCDLAAGVTGGCRDFAGIPIGIGLMSMGVAESAVPIGA